MDLLSGSYSFSRSGERDKFSECIFDCFHSYYYYSLKCLPGLIQEPWEFFLDEICFYIDINKKGELLKGNFEDSGFIGKTVVEEKSQPEGEEALKLIDESLLMGNPLILQLWFNELPHSVFYKQSDEEFFLFHGFLLLAKEGENYIFLETQTEINKERLKTWDKNPELGVISREMLLKGLRPGTVMTRFSFSFTEECETHNQELLKAITASFHQPKEDKGDFTRYYGLEAIEILAEKGVDMAFNASLPGTEQTLSQLLLWIYYGAMHKREYLREFLVSRHQTAYSDITGSLDTSIREWKRLITLLMRKMSKQEIWDSSLAENLRGVVKGEKELHSALKLNFS